MPLIQILRPWIFPAHRCSQVWTGLAEVTTGRPICRIARRSIETGAPADLTRNHKLRGNYWSVDVGIAYAISKLGISKASSAGQSDCGYLRFNCNMPYRSYPSAWGSISWRGNSSWDSLTKRWVSPEEAVQCHPDHRWTIRRMPHGNGLSKRQGLRERQAD